MDLDEEEYVKCNGPAKSPDFSCEEITGPQGLEMPLHEVMPGAPAALWTGLKSILLQNAADCCSRDIMDAELSKFPENPLGSSTGVLGHPENQFPDFFGLATATRLSRCPSTLHGLDPTRKRPWMDDRNQFFNCWANAKTKFDQPGPFRESNGNPLWQLATQNPILGLEIFNVPDQFLIRRPGDQQQQRVQDSCRVVIFHKLLNGQEMTWFRHPADEAGGERTTGSRSSTEAEPIQISDRLIIRRQSA
ncbi:MAG: hypothetical protein SGJ20_06445 [Planctomycetota bacterium]|nr:hypothetical protein [Planctomycetota bacterium]